MKTRATIAIDENKEVKWWTTRERELLLLLELLEQHEEFGCTHTHTNPLSTPDTIIITNRKAVDKNLEKIYKKADSCLSSYGWKAAVKAYKASKANSQGVFKSIAKAWKALFVPKHLKPLQSMKAEIKASRQAGAKNFSIKNIHTGITTELKNIAAAVQKVCAYVAPTVHANFKAEDVKEMEYQAKMAKFKDFQSKPKAKEETREESRYGMKAKLSGDFNFLGDRKVNGSSIMQEVTESEVGELELGF